MPDCDKHDCCGDGSYGYNIDRANPDPPGTQTYTITLSSDPSDGGTTTGAGSWAAGSQVQIQAYPAEGYEFNGWSGDLVLSDNPASVFMDGDKTLVANFELIGINLSVTVSPSGSGTTTGQGNYSYGDTATVTAIPNTYSVFDHWSNGSIDNPIDVLMDSDQSLTAFFTYPTYEVTGTVSPDGAGTITGLGSYQAGQTANLGALANTGSFTGWGGDLSGMNNPESLLIDNNKSVIANFSPCNCGLVDYPYLLHSPYTASVLLKTVEPSPDNPPFTDYTRRKACLRFVCACIGANQQVLFSAQYGGSTASGLDLTQVLWNNIAIPTTAGTYVYVFEFYGWRGPEVTPPDVRGWISSDTKFTISQRSYPGITD